MKVAIAQMVLGVLITIGFVALEVTVLRLVCSFFPFNLIFPSWGLLVIGCGVAQFLKARG